MFFFFFTLFAGFYFSSVFVFYARIYFDTNHILRDKPIKHLEHRVLVVVAVAVIVFNDLYNGYI